MKVLAFAASSSTKSINHQLVRYAASLLEEAEIELLDLNDYELPLFSEDKETELGEPALAKAFLDKIGSSDAVIISFAEHNGSYTVAYKNIFDWASRINQKVFQNKPMVLLAAAPGAGGAASVLSAAIASAPFFEGKVKASVSVPNFHENFDIEHGRITNTVINTQLLTAINSLLVNTAMAVKQVI
ncbi:MAG: NADPH-dependent FMN reductase [Gammaproteobacteria bacterium]|jgi:NAD(P)H-dependent FMN reductase